MAGIIGQAAPQMAKTGQAQMGGGKGGSTGGSMTQPGTPPPTAPMKNSIADKVARYREIGGGSVANPMSRGMRNIAQQQYRDVSGNPSIAGLMNMMPDVMPQQPRDTMGVRQNDYIRSLLDIV